MLFLRQGSPALRTAQDPDLAERIIEQIEERFPRPGSRRSRAGAAGAAGGGADTSCIQLLVCKAAPFLRGMQRSLQAVLRPQGTPQGTPQGGRGGTEDVPSGGPKGDPGGDPRASAARAQTQREQEQEQWRRLSPVQRMFAHMPSGQEVVQHADVCVQRFPNCKVAH